jgi:tetratricopeptide (TPR) repeat protein
VGDTAEVLRRTTRGDLVPPRQVKSDVPAALEAICLKALALRPAQRYGTALELAEDVEHWLADEPVSAWREPVGVRARRWLKRHRVLVLAAVTALLVGTLSLGVATALLTAKNDELRQANQRETAAREQEEIAHKEEAKARRLAQANFEMANQAAEDYLFKVVEDDRLKEHDLTELRKKLILSAGDFYQKFIAARQSDPTLELMLGRAHLNLGMLKYELSEMQPSLKDLQNARARFERLTAKAPGNPEYRYYRGKTSNELSRCYLNLKRYEDMGQLLRENLPACEQLVKEHPDQKKYRTLEEHCIRLQGILWRERGEPAQAEPFYRRALALQRRIAGDCPDAAERNILTYSLGDLGKVLRLQNRQKEARQCLEEALEINRGLVREAPHNPKYRTVTAWLNFELFWTLRDQREGAEAVKAMRRAVDTYRQLMLDFPTLPGHRGEFVSSARMLAEALTGGGTIKEAVALGREAVRVGEKLVADFPREPAFRLTLTHACYNLARALHRSGATLEGERYRRRTLALTTELCREYPQVPEYEEQRGIAHSGLSFLFGETGRLPAAREQGLKAVAIFEKLTRVHPSSTEYQFRFAEACLQVLGTDPQQGQSDKEIRQKGITAIEKLLQKEKNARYERVYGMLKFGQQVLMGGLADNQGLSALGDAVVARTGITGELTANDPLAPWQSYYKVHRLTLQAAKHYQIDLSGSFDTRLRLDEGTGQGMSFNNGIGPPFDRSSRLIFSPEKTGSYRIVVTSARPRATGVYTLKVREALPAGPVQRITGQLTEQDKKMDEKHYQEHRMKLSAGLAYTIEFVDLDFDARASIVNKTNDTMLAQSAWSIRGEYLIPRIDFTPTKDESYTLVVTSERPGQTGAYTIRLQAYKLAEP